jgi:hypothetical protein
MKKLIFYTVAVSSVFTFRANAVDVQTSGFTPSTCEVTGFSSQLLNFRNVDAVGKEVTLSDVKLRCNDIDGATVTLRSAEGGLESDEDEDFSIAYDATLSTPLGEITLNAPGGYGPNEESVSKTYEGSIALAGGVYGHLSMKTKQGEQWSGGYSDTLTVQIVAN